MIKVYQITDRGHIFAQNPRLPSNGDSKILYELDKRTGATRETLQSLTGMSVGEVSHALGNLQRSGLVMGV